MLSIKLNWFAHLLGVTALHLISLCYLSTKRMQLPRLPHSTVFFCALTAIEKMDGNSRVLCLLLF